MKDDRDGKNGCFVHEVDGLRQLYVCIERIQVHQTQMLAKVLLMEYSVPEPYGLFNCAPSVHGESVSPCSLYNV